MPRWRPVYRSGTLRSQYLAALAKVALAAPLAVVGAVIHVVPCQLVDVAASVPANRSVRATVKVLGSFFLYLATYAGLGLLVGHTRGPALGMLAAAAAPACGYLALRLAERIHRIGGARQGFRLARDHARLLDAVLADRAAVVRVGTRPGPTGAAGDLADRSLTDGRLPATMD